MNVSNNNYDETKVEEEILDLSQCINDSDEKVYLKAIMGKKKFKTLLRYRGSRDGWKAEDFHRLCDGLGPTIALFKQKDNGQCIGGFTKAQWSSSRDDTE